MTKLAIGPRTPKPPVNRDSKIKKNRKKCEQKARYLSKITGVKFEYEPVADQKGRGSLLMDGEPLEGMTRQRNKDIFLFMESLGIYETARTARGM